MLTEAFAHEKYYDEKYMGSHKGHPFETDYGTLHKWTHVKGYAERFKHPDAEGYIGQVIKHSPHSKEYDPKSPYESQLRDVSRQDSHAHLIHSEYHRNAKEAREHVAFKLAQKTEGGVSKYWKKHEAEGGSPSEKKLTARLDRKDEKRRQKHKEYMDRLDKLLKGHEVKEETMFINEVAPPGREKQVRKLKEKYGEKSSTPYKIAWAQYNKEETALENLLVRLVEIRKPLTLQQRIKRGNITRRIESKLKARRKALSGRLADPARLTKRARHAAVLAIRKRFAGEMGVKYDELSPSQKAQIDAKVIKNASRIGVIAKRLIPVVRKKDQERLAARNKAK